MKLCGHATLASALVLWETGVLKHDAATRFHTQSGWLTCMRDGDWIVMDFPARPCEPCDAPTGLAEAIGCEPLFCGVNEDPVTGSAHCALGPYWQTRLGKKDERKRKKVPATKSRQDR